MGYGLVGSVLCISARAHATVTATANAPANGGVFRGLAYEKYDWSSDGDADAPAFRGRADASADVGRVTGFATSGGRRWE